MIDPDYSIDGLVIALAQQAAQQAKRGNRSAALWLATDGAFMLECIHAETAAYKLGLLAREKLQRNRKTNRMALHSPPPPVIAERMPRNTRHKRQA
jgi:hypothetical protein